MKRAIRTSSLTYRLQLKKKFKQIFKRFCNKPISSLWYLLRSMSIEDLRFLYDNFAAADLRLFFYSKILSPS